MPESVDQCSKIQFALKKPETKRRIDYDEATVTKSVKHNNLSNMKIWFLCVCRLRFGLSLQQNEPLEVDSVL